MDTFFSPTGAEIECPESEMERDAWIAPVCPCPQAPHFLPALLAHIEYCVALLWRNFPADAIKALKIDVVTHVYKNLLFYEKTNDDHAAALWFARVDWQIYARVIAAMVSQFGAARCGHVADELTDEEVFASPFFRYIVRLVKFFGCTTSVSRQARFLRVYTKLNPSVGHYLISLR
jgi:hypothetical protein